MSLSESDISRIKQLQKGDKLGMISLVIVWVIIFGYIGFQFWRPIPLTEAQGWSRLGLAMQLWMQVWENPEGQVTWADVFLIQQASTAIFFILAGLLISFFKLMDIRQNRLLAELSKSLLTDGKDAEA